MNPFLHSFIFKGYLRLLNNQSPYISCTALSHLVLLTLMMSQLTSALISFTAYVQIPQAIPPHSSSIQPTS